jgi:hypothetical protein
MNCAIVAALRDDGHEDCDTLAFLYLRLPANLPFKSSIFIQAITSCDSAQAVVGFCLTCHKDFLVLPKSRRPRAFMKVHTRDLLVQQSECYNRSESINQSVKPLLYGKYSFPIVVEP